MTPWLLLDVSYLAYRAYHSTPGLRHGDIGTGVMFGVLREVVQLQQNLTTSKIAFCFDYGKPLRKFIYPKYKKRRNEGSEKEKAARLEVKKQVDVLRTTYLPMIGFQNLLYQKGYEADDVIATIVKERPKKEFVIVSSDKDLYQLLTPRVSIWRPTSASFYTVQCLEDEYGIGPELWADAKAISGCGTDEIEGVDGVAEKTAAKFLSGKLKTSSAKYKAIIAGNALWRRNLQLVKLPYPDIQEFKLVKDNVTPEGWKALIDTLGMESLRKYIPGIPKVKTRYTKKDLLGRTH